MTAEVADGVFHVGECRGVTDVAEMKARSAYLRRRSILRRSDYQLGEKLFQRPYTLFKDSNLLRSYSRLARINHFLNKPSGSDVRHCLTAAIVAAHTNVQIK
jgi:hypothetical protein